MSETAFLRLWQLISPALPVGAFAYSEGLESAVAAGWVRDQASAAAWIRGRLAHGPGRLDAPIAARQHDAWTAGDAAAVETWNRHLVAAREARELREGDRDQAQALARLLVGLGVDDARAWLGRADASYPTLFALAAVRWDVAREAAVTGLLWAWLEAQIAAAVKLVPLGQTAGQRLLFEAAGELPAITRRALACSDDEVGASTPGAAIAAARHETLEVRLFRS